MEKVSISCRNSKMGELKSVSLPAITTCRECACWNECYGHKLERIRKSVRDAYKRNLDILRKDPDFYWRQVEGVIMMERAFRFHVSGDIPDREYFDRLESIVERNQHCEVLCFTKRYEYVNDWVRENRRMPPENLHLFFSGWEGLKMDNPFGFPEAHVRYKDGRTTAHRFAKDCEKDGMAGDCASCFLNHTGCWAMKRHVMLRDYDPLKIEQVVFEKH